MKASTRERSVGLRWWLDRITAKYATAASRLSQITSVDSPLAVITWVTHSTTNTATAATTATAYGRRRLAGSGSGTSRLLSGSWLRPIVYWMSPTAIPAAANPK